MREGLPGKGKLIVNNLLILLLLNYCRRHYYTGTNEIRFAICEN